MEKDAFLRPAIHSQMLEILCYLLMVLKGGQKFINRDRSYIGSQSLRKC